MWKTSVVLAAAVFGCHSSMDDMSSMRSDIDDARRETTRHLDASRAAVTMEQMHDEMENHRGAMMHIMVDMDAMMDGMAMHCDGLGVDGMRAMHGDLLDDLTQHLATMEAQTELAASRAEVERHAASMFSMIADMDVGTGNMHCH